MVFVKTVVYHALGTSMPYPFGYLPRHPGGKATPERLPVHLHAPVSIPVGGHASITSPGMGSRHALRPVQRLNEDAQRVIEHHLRLVG